MIEGRIYTYSIINVPTAEFAGKTPYAVLVVELEDGQRMLSRLENFTSEMKLEIGMKVVESGRDDSGNLLFSVV